MNLQEMIHHSLENSPSGNTTLRYDIGDEFRGETHLVLGENGQYSLNSTVRIGRVFQAYSGDGMQEDFIEILKTMQENEIWKVQPSRSLPGDGEPVALIGLSTETELAVVRCFGSELKDHPSFDAVQEKILIFIRKVSNNEVLELGR